MKKIIIAVSTMLILSCNENSPFSSSNNNTENTGNINENYVKVQKQIQSSYFLLKALNSGAITQEEYDKLKIELFNI